MYWDIKPKAKTYSEHLWNWCNNEISVMAVQLGKKIELTQENENDWVFAYLNYSNNKKGFAVF